MTSNVKELYNGLCVKYRSLCEPIMESILFLTGKAEAFATREADYSAGNKTINFLVMVHLVTLCCWGEGA
ncbi:hypothetical protein D1B31_11285 [Neobacillus notoginsengisoli]|uniref:Uncharacterized protein n=1 Tax=Neobacillus notoginsengisoli TaxID=1578198 RepID=A0A417YUH1_9BACI|nr:hypothetical protein [Neobacillus notoginsengisoli]RHW40765.1 hypothetical protein D1B31_11285 [Neobacillus notoginsengisoli]